MADGLLESLADIQTLQDLADRYELGSLLGEGRFSKVWRATPTSADTAVSSTPVALKEIALDVLEDDEEAFEMLEAEVDALRHAAKVATRRLIGAQIAQLDLHAARHHRYARDRDICGGGSGRREIDHHRHWRGAAGRRSPTIRILLVNCRR